MSDIIAGSVIGGVVGALASLLTLSAPRSLRATLVYSQLVMMVGIYVGFATAELTTLPPPDRNALGDIGVHFASALLYAIAGAWALTSGRARVVALLVLTHGFYDLAAKFVSPVAPDWYGVACAAFDIAAGGVYVAASRRLANS